MGEQQQQGHGRLLQGDGDEDQAQIGGGGIGKGALEIHLGEGHQGTGNGADRAHHQQHGGCHRRQPQQRHQFEQHQGTGGHHHRIAQNRGGVRSLHGLIQPEVHRELGAFPHRSSNQAQANQAARQGGQRATRLGRVLGLGGPAVEIGELHRAGQGREGHNPHQQQHIADPFGQEGIAGRGHHQGLGIPEPHQ